MSLVGQIRIGVYVVVVLLMVTAFLLAKGRLTSKEAAVNVRLLIGAQVLITGAIAVIDWQRTNVMSAAAQLIIFCAFWAVSRRIIDGGTYGPIPPDFARLTREYPFIVAYHRNDTWWHEAPLPGRLHRCSPQTTAVQHDMVVERCACGAIRLDRQGWMEKNSRRR